MDNQELYNKLLQAYSTINLNRITGTLLNLYKNKDYSTIRQYANRIADYVNIDEDSDSKCFMKLIVLYHPDKVSSIRNSINNYWKNQDYDKLVSFSHVLLFDKLLGNGRANKINSDIDYKTEYTWDNNTRDGYQFVNDNDIDIDLDNFQSRDEPLNFYDAVKLRMYGNTNIEYPTYYLEDFEEFELADNGIEDLDGVQYCKHVQILDLSDNNITDISPLWELTNLSELFLSNNSIGYIDALSNLNQLKILDISGNSIDDISPLFQLYNLEYVNLAGNNISLEQISVLKKNDITVIHNQIILK